MRSVKLDMKTQFGRKSATTFTPPVWLKNSHLQTIMPKFLLKSPAIAYVNERIRTPDDDFIDLAWSMPTGSRSIKGLVILFHGLEGSSQSHYITHLIQALQNENFGAVVMHFRGCSGEPNLTSKAYHSGAIFDPEFIIRLVNKRYPTLPLFAVGFSLGGNMLMKLMAMRNNLPIQASVCVSAPLNLTASSAAVNIGFSRIYQRHLMKSMKANLLHKMQFIDMSSDINISTNDIEQMTTFREFDEYITARLHGFKGADDYYQKASALHDLPLINKPTLILHAVDDPFMNEEVIPSAELINDYVAYEYSQYGGHVGFMQAVHGKNPLWLPTRITEFLLEVG